MLVSSDRIPKVGVGRRTPQEGPGGVYTCTASTGHMGAFRQQRSLEAEMRPSTSE